MSSLGPALNKHVSSQQRSFRFSVEQATRGTTSNSFLEKAPSTGVFPALPQLRMQPDSVPFPLSLASPSFPALPHYTDTPLPPPTHTTLALSLEGMRVCSALTCEPLQAGPGVERRLSEQVSIGPTPVACPQDGVERSKPSRTLSS